MAVFIVSHSLHYTYIHHTMLTVVEREGGGTALSDVSNCEKFRSHWLQQLQYSLLHRVSEMTYTVSSGTLNPSIPSIQEKNYIFTLKQLW